MSDTGRPHVLDESKMQTVLSLLSVGCSRTTAARFVNCDPKTIYNTAKRDPKFAEQLGRAENMSEYRFLSRIAKAGDETRYWRSAAWGLERMFPDRFGRRSPESVTPQQLAVFISRMTEMLVEEIPVARYRKLVLARLNQFMGGEIPKLFDFPAPKQKRLVREKPSGKTPAEKTLLLPR
jgi:hypothetical protein